MAGEYPILDIDQHLRDAVEWLDRADGVAGESFTDAATGESFPSPPELDAAESLWRQAIDLIRQAREKLRPLVAAEEKRYDEDEAFWCRDK